MQGLVHMSKSRNRSTCTPAPPHVAREMMHGLVHMYSCRPALCTPGWCTDLPSCTKVHLHRVVHLHSAHMSSWSQYAQVCKGRFLRRSNLARTPTVIVILSIRGNGKSWKLCALFSDWVGGPAFIGPAIIYYGLGRPGEISLSIAKSVMGHQKPLLPLQSHFSQIITSVDLLTIRDCHLLVLFPQIQIQIQIQITTSVEVPMIRNCHLPVLWFPPTTLGGHPPSPS